MQLLTFSLRFFKDQGFKQYCDQDKRGLGPNLSRYERDGNEFTLYFETVQNAYLFGYGWALYQQESDQRIQVIEAQIKDVEQNYEMGLLTAEEYRDQLEKIKEGSKRN